MICLFSSALAYSILASVFSAPTANEVCGLPIYAQTNPNFVAGHPPDFVLSWDE